MIQPMGMVPDGNLTSFNLTALGDAVQLAEERISSDSDLELD